MKRMSIKAISSKENPVFKQLKSISQDNTSYRKSQKVWIEGEHLCLTAIESGLKISQVVILDTTQADILKYWSERCDNIIQLPVSLMSALSALPSPAWVCCTVELHATQAIKNNESAVVLDQVQDPGNAGAILRCAAAFGFKQIITTDSTVALWSAKVIRSAMGAHFNLQINESLDVNEISALELPLLLTDVHHGALLHQLTEQRKLPWPCIWIFGHEGRGASPSWAGSVAQRVRIAQPGGQESLNVAAAAAICLHASASQRVQKS